MNFLYLFKMKNIVKDIMQSEILRSVGFHMICWTIYNQKLNILLNFCILSHTGFVVFNEIFNFIEKYKKDKYIKEQLMKNTFTYRKLLEKSHRNAKTAQTFKHTETE